MGIVAARTWYVEGLAVPCPVVSGSMAETLLGTHRTVRCRDCGHRFVCEADAGLVLTPAVCPNCGYPENPLGSVPELAGDRVLIVKSIYQFRPPRRWEVVAFRHPRRASQTLVKRVVGLPGESIQIRYGDVYADGQIQRKTLPQQRALAILVHDANCRPSIDPAPPPRWQGGDDSQWVAAGGRFVHPKIPGKPATIDWLEYCHWYRVPADGNPGKVRYGPVTDICGYDQGRTRRQEDVHPVADLMLSLRLVRASGKGRLVLRASDGRDEFRVWIEPGRGRYEVWRNGRAVPWTGGRLPPKDGPITLEVSLADRQFLLAFDGHTAETVAYDPSGPPRQPTSRPLAVGSQGALEVEVCDLRVYRDVYYTCPIGVQGRWGLDEPYGLGEREYFVLGDNSPISDDSRTWPEGPAVADNLLVGKPLVVHFPARLVELAGWRFPVPDPGRIRYIR